jgi:hypothetical protein
MTEKKPVSNNEKDESLHQQSEDIYSPTQVNEYLPKEKGTSFLTSLLLVLVYIVLAGVGIVVLGLIALFVMCMA